jgi:redox-regulated HSP33 family molecular chaperone
MALSLIDDADLEVLRSEGEAVVDCHFCHERYIFSVEELTAIQQDARTEHREPSDRE